MTAVTEARGSLGVRAGCVALGLPRATWYRNQRPVSRETPGSSDETRPSKASPRALRPEECSLVLDVLNGERFVDMSVPQVHATLLDEGQFLCSPRTMYRILDEVSQVRERRAQRQHPIYTKPELLASLPNQVWSWDITKLKGPAKWNYFHLYVILDIYSRYVVGWMVAHRESARLAKKLIAETVAQHKVDRGQLTLHADRGSSMTSKDVAFLLADLGVTKTHSRPHVSNDNAYSEAQFRTLKYRPEFPERFGSLQDARAFCRQFFGWYNFVHYHSGIAMLTPHVVHFGHVEEVIAQRSRVLEQARALHPERFVAKTPAQPRRPKAAWINPPTRSALTPAAH